MDSKKEEVTASMNTTTSNISSNTISAADILKTMKDLQKLLTPPPLIGLGGLKIIESRLLEGMMVPIRPHIKRRTQREAYHKRIQKKWIRRFGMTEFSDALLCDAAAFGQAFAVVFPKHMALLRHAEVFK
jgi:hypothetical protein